MKPVDKLRSQNQDRALTFVGVDEDFGDGSEEMLERPRSVGRPLKGQEVCIMDDDANVLAADQTGLIYVRNAQTMSGYLKNEEATEAAMRDGEIGAEHLEAYAREHLSDHKVPRRWHVVDSLPRNPTGKVLKHKLVERYEAS